MATYTELETSNRLLALGNEYLADDAFGPMVAREARRRLGNEADIVATEASGFHLLDDVLGVDRLIVVDTIETGKEPPGTVRVWEEAALRPAPGGSPHVVGIFEALAAARAAGLAAPRRVTFVTVEAADCETVGGPMYPAVEAAVRRAADEVVDRLSATKARVRYA